MLEVSIYIYIYITSRRDFDVESFKNAYSTLVGPCKSPKL